MSDSGENSNIQKSQHLVRVKLERFSIGYVNPASETENLTDAASVSSSEDESENTMANYMPMPVQFNISDDWVIYEARLIQFFLAYAITDEKRKAAILLTALSCDAFKVIKNVCFPDGPDTKNFDELCELMKKQFSRVVSIFSERSKFYEAKQQSSETVVDWLARLKSLCLHCDFQDYLENILRDKFVCGLAKGPVFEKVIELKHDSKLDKCVEVALQKELSLREKAPQAEIHKLKSNKKFNKYPNKKAVSCYACGEGGHDFKSCSYKQYKCKVCNKVGHLAKVCKSKKSNNCLEAKVEKASEEECFEDFGSIYTISNLHSIKSDVFIANLKINGEEVAFEIDTGSSVSVCAESFYNEKCTRYPLKKVNTVLKTYDGELIKPLGVFEPTVGYKGKCFKCPILVIRNGGRPLVGRDFLRMVNPTLDGNFINNLSTSNSDVNVLLEEFSELFGEDLGRYKFGKVKIELKDPNTKPVFCKPRSVPLAFQDKFKEQLSKSVESGMLRKIDYSLWGTPLVPVLKKDGDLRICADYKTTVNPFVKDFKFSLPLIEDLFAALNGGELFSKLDMSSAYNQLELEEESQLLLAWSTQEGLFAPTRLTFGISPACSIFQSVMYKTLQGCSGVICFLDDILVTGVNQNEHLRNLKTVFKKLAEAGLRLKRSKCVFFQTRVSYLGYIIDKDGLHKDPSKIDAIIKAPEPKTTTQIKAFVGLVGYYSKFFPNMAQVLAPVYRLLQKDNSFEWTEDCANAFKLAKEVISSDRVLTHYDRNRPVKLVCDAALYGIGAAIFHVMDDGQERPIAFASQVLSKAELNYSATDREALAIYFGVKRFQHYLLGRHFILLTDHKPLVSIFGKKSGIPAMAAGRLQRWSVFLSNFDFEIEYIQGKENFNADFLSRFPVKISDFKNEDASYLNFIASGTDKLIDKNDIKIQSRRDIIISKVIDCVQFGWPEKLKSEEEYKPYYQKNNELSIEENVLMWGYRIIVPVKLRERLLSELHAAHSGMVKMKARARSYFWWPSIDKDIEQLVRSCEPCQINAPNPHKSAISPWQQSSYPFQRIHMDYLGPFKDKHYLVIQDSYSKWVEVFKMRGMTAAEAVEKLRECCSRFGIPDVIVSDNGTQFTSSEFQTFCTRNGIRYVTSPPYKPQSNGAAENSVKTFKNGMSKVLSDPKNSATSIETLVCRHLFFYRSSLHATTQQTPYKLMFGREMRTQFDKLKPNILATVQKKIDEKILKENEGRQNKEFTEGDAVWMREFKANRQSWSKATIEKQIGINVFLCTNANGTHKKHSDQIRKRESPVEPSTSDTPLADKNTKKDETPKATSTTEDTLPKPVSSSSESINFPAKTTRSGRKW